MGKLAIKSDGSVRGTLVYEENTGEQITNIISFTYTMGHNNVGRLELVCEMAPCILKGNIICDVQGSDCPNRRK